MDLQVTPYTIPLILATAVSLSSSLGSWRRQRAPGAKALLALMLLVALWSATYALEISNVTLSAKLFWSQGQYIGITLVPFFLLIFAIQYTGVYADRLTIRNIILLLIEPMLILMLVWTNQWHGFIWHTTEVATTDGFEMLIIVAYGGAFWIHVAISYVYILISTIIIFNYLRGMPKLFQSQSFAIGLGVLTPWLANAVYITGMSPFEGLDLTPFAFTITGVALAWGTLRYQLFDVVPIARDVLIEGLHDGILVLDIQNRVVDLNPAAAHLLNTQINRAIGQPFAKLTAEWPQLTAVSTLTHNLSDKLSLCQTIDNKTYELRIEALMDKHGQGNGRLLTLHNITTQKQYTTKLKLAWQQAEIAQQQADTAREEAEKALSKAEASGEAKSNFLNTMSHEIRTPIAAVIGMSNLLRETSLNAEQKEYLKTIAENSDSLLEIINNVLEYAKIEAGDLKLNHQPFDLRDTLETTIQPFILDANKKEIEMKWHIKDNTPNVICGDSIRLRQILASLLSNAVKFTEEGRIVINVSSVIVSNENGNIKNNDGAQVELLFSIQDSGIGFTKTYAEKELFQSFSQADTSNTRAHGGIGLHLAINKKLCKLMGGTIWAESELGKGSTFYFTIIAQITTATPVHYLKSSKFSLRDKRVLIVAKNATSRRTISQEMRQAGMSPYVAGRASEVEYWLKKDPFDVVFIESSLFIEEPEDILNEIQEITPPLPLILLTNADTIISDAQKALFTGILQQPITASTLYTSLITVLSTDNKPTKKQADSIATNSEEMGKHHPLRLLLVEDNVINQKVAKQLLGRLGYTVDIAKNGQLGIEAVYKKVYDVILMDIQMPIMDGMEATKRIRQELDSTLQPKIIAITAHAMEGDREQYLSIGMDDYISKPIKLDMLVEALYQCEQINGRLPTPLPATKKLSPPIKVNNSAASNVAEQMDDTLPIKVGMAAPIDMAALEAMIGPDAEEFLIEMTPIFLEDTKPLLQQLDEAINNNDVDSIKRVAHTLKGTSASLGMTQLSQLSKEIELIAKANTVAKASDKLIAIEAEYARILSVLASK